MRYDIDLHLAGYRWNIGYREEGDARYEWMELDEGRMRGVYGQSNMKEGVVIQGGVR